MARRKMIDHCDGESGEIFTNDNGYSVRKVFVDAPPDLNRERSKVDGFAVGTTVAAQGGNGTMAGIFKNEGER